MKKYVGLNPEDQRCSTDAVNGSQDCNSHQDLSPKSQKNYNLLSTNTVKSNNIKLKKIWKLFGRATRTIFATIGIGTLITLFLLWRTEVDQHSRDSSKLRALEREQENTTKQLDSLKEENSKLRDALPLYGLFGPRVSLISRIDLKKEKGAKSVMGKYPDSPYLIIEFRGIIVSEGLQCVHISVGGKIGKMMMPERTTGFPLPLKKGYKKILATSTYNFAFAVEKAEVNNILLAVGVSPGTLKTEYSKIETMENFPDEDLDSAFMIINDYPE